MRSEKQGGLERGGSRTKRSWLRIGLRIVRDAAVAVAVMTLVPIAIIAVRGENAWGHGNFGNSIRAKLALVEFSRPLTVVKDPSITPMQAGLAYNALQPDRKASEFAIVELASRPALSWQTAPLTADMFVNHTMTFGFHGPSNSAILEAVKDGFTPKEAAYLHTLATAPVWRAFDLVARAKAVDVVGGSFKLPFPDGATADRMPTDYKGIREITYAAVSRAAYHMSIGQRDSAEAVLRSIVSVGFAMTDNGHNNLDSFMGNVIVAVGRDALGRFYRITDDPRALLPPFGQQQKPASAVPSRLSMDEMRRFLIDETGNPNEYLGMRYEALRLLSAASCTNVRELMFGNGADVDAAIRSARAQLARYPSERALVDLVAQLPQPRADELKYDPIGALAVSSATVAGTVLRNPRLAACTAMVTGYYRGPW